MIFGAEVISIVATAGQGDHTVDEVMDGSQGEGIVEEVAAQFDDAAVRAVADQDQAKGQLLQPGFGDGQMEENAVGVGVGPCKSGVESLLGLGGLLVDELAADEVVSGQFGDGAAGQGVEGELLACCRGQGMGGGAGGRDSGGWAG